MKEFDLDRDLPIDKMNNDGCLALCAGVLKQAYDDYCVCRKRKDIYGAEAIMKFFQRTFMVIAVGKTNEEFARLVVETYEQETGKESRMHIHNLFGMLKYHNVSYEELVEYVGYEPDYKITYEEYRLLLAAIKELEERNRTDE